jgi:flagellar biogenesis protein FliO
MPDPTPRPARRPPPLLIGAGVLVTAVALGLPQLTSAPPPAPEKAAPAAPPAAPALLPALARLAGGLVVVCGLCVLATRYLADRPAPAPTGTMDVVASLPIGARCAVHLVRAGGRRLLVGTDPAGVKCLVELPGTPADPPAEPEPAAVVVGPARAPDADGILAVLARARATPPG